MEILLPLQDLLFVRTRALCCQIPTCFTQGFCRTTPIGVTSLPICASLLSMKHTLTAACSVHMLPMCSADSNAWRISMVHIHSSFWRQQPLGIQRNLQNGSLKN